MQDKVTNERLDDVIANYHGSIRAIALELKASREKEHPSASTSLLVEGFKKEVEKV